MFRHGYHKMMWGLILILIDIRIMGLDIMPDFIGYIMIVSGLGILADQNDFYTKAKPYALILFFLSFFDLFELNRNFLGDFITPTSLVFMAIGSIGTILKLFMYYNICQGIMELSGQQGLNQLKESTFYRWRGYFIFSLLSSILTPFTINFYQGILTSVLVFAYIALFIAELFMISLIKNSRDSVGAIRILQ